MIPTSETGDYPQHSVSHLFAADGSLLSVIEFVPYLDENPADRRNPENFLKRMYHLPEK
nr:MAG TPA: hypothetical protein [Caudoviricetes sp.]